MKNLEINSLPVTRKAHFKDSIKNRWRLIFLCSFMLMIGFLPMFASLLIKAYLVGNLQSNPDYFINNKLTSDGYNLYVFTELINIGAITVLSLFFSILLSGTMQIIKKICWSEGVQFLHDFKIGIKQNYKSTFLIILLVFILFDVNAFSFIFNLNLFIKMFILFVSVFMVAPLLLTGLIYSSIYSVNLKQFFKNSCILSLKSYAFSLGVSVLLIIAFLVNYYLLVNPVIISIISIVFGLLSGFILLIIYEFYFNVFDKFINLNNHKDQLRRGLY